MTNKSSETFYNNFIPDFLSVYQDKLSRYLKSDTTKKLLLIGSVSQKKLDFFREFFNNLILYVYNETSTEYKNLDESIVQNETYPFTIEEVNKLLDSNKKFNMILTQGQISIENFKFIAKNYINLLEKDGIIIFENIQSINNINDIIDALPLNIKVKMEIIDLRRVNGKYDNLCLIVDKK